MYLQIPIMNYNIQVNTNTVLESNRKNGYVFCDWCMESIKFGTLKCENASICEKVAKCQKISTLNVIIDAICEKITLNVTKLGSLNV